MSFSSTTAQDNSFLRAAFPNTFLDDCVLWVGANLDPEDVFDDDALENWAINNGFKVDDYA